MLNKMRKISKTVAASGGKKKVVSLYEPRSLFGISQL